MKTFDPYKYCNQELNHYWAKLMVTVNSPKLNVTRIADNYQRLPDSLTHDMHTYIDRTHDELMSDLGHKSAKDIFDWSYKTKLELEQYSHWYWDATEEFFTAVCASSLPNYFNDEEVGDAMAKINSKLIEAYENKKQEFKSIQKELDTIGNLKVKANAELSGLRGKIDQLNEEMDAMKAQQNNYRKEMTKLDNELHEKKEEFHKELKKKYDEMEEKFKDEISEFKKKRDSLERETEALTSKSKLAKAVISFTSLFNK